MLQEATDFAQKLVGGSYGKHLIREYMHKPDFSMYSPHKEFFFNTLFGLKKIFKTKVLILNQNDVRMQGFCLASREIACVFFACELFAVKLPAALAIGKPARRLAANPVALYVVDAAVGSRLSAEFADSPAA
jgi:hypothetical protein